MAKPTGFIEFQRELPTDLIPDDRILHWNEFHRSLPVEKLRDQGARCMDCGIPYCHQQSHPRVERPGISRIVAAGARTPAEDQ